MSTIGVKDNVLKVNSVVDKLQNSSPYSNQLIDILACPYCKNLLVKHDSGCNCQKCDSHFPLNGSGNYDLRLQRPKSITYGIDLGISVDISDIPLYPLKSNPQPEVELTDIDIPKHLSPELLSYFPKANSSNSLMLDLGCGTTVHQSVCEQAGFHYIGLDYKSSQATLLGDAHALPFQDNTFEFILSIAVLEHIQFPQIMLQEAFRVLNPGGLFIGTVAFLEPFHDHSYYHHTHLGLANHLKGAGFTVSAIAPNPQWSGLKAQAGMGLFPRLPRIITNAIVYPIETLHNIWWSLGRILKKRSDQEEILRYLKTTGALTFIAHKEDGQDTEQSGNANPSIPSRQT